MKTKYKTYEYYVKRGVDDLEGISGQASEWWTESDWAKYDADEPNRKQRNKDYVAKLKKEGRYGEEVKHELTMAYNPLYDKRKSSSKRKDSYKFDILDFSKGNEKVTYV